MTGSAVVRLAVATALLALAASGEAKPSKQLWRLTPEQVASKVSIKDDAFELEAMLDTQEAWPGTAWGWGKFIPDALSDGFLRAFVDKATGETRFQVYAKIHSSESRGYKTVAYLTDEGPHHRPVERLLADYDCLPLFGCGVTEHLTFDVSEGTLREVASVYRPNGTEKWLFKITGDYADGGYFDAITPAEAAGLLQAVDAYRASLKPRRP